MPAMNQRVLASLVAVACALPAQQAPTAVTPHLIIETVGPDGWRSRFGPTNFGVMLASEEGRRVWQPSVAPLLGMWAAVAGGEQAYKEASERLMGFGGSVRMAAFVNEDAAANIALVFDPDGRSDLEAIAADLRGWLDAALPGEWREHQLAGGKVTLKRSGPDFVTAPIVSDGRLQLMAGDFEHIDNATGLAAWLAARPATLASPKPGSPALRVTLDLKQLIALSELADSPVIVKALGLDGLQQMTLALRAAGPRIEVDADIALDGEPRGIVRAFLPSSAGISGLTALLPARASAWKIGRFDLNALFEGIMGAIAADEGDQKVRDEIRRELGMDPGPDLLAHATDELLVVGSPLRDLDRVSEAGWMLTWRLRDDRKFGEGFDKMIASAKPFLSPSETVEVDDVRLRRYGNMLGYDLWMAVGNGVFVIAAGRDAEADATALLRKAKAATFAPATAPGDGFRGLDRHLPPGVNGVARAEIDELVGVPIDWWLELLPELLPLDLRPDVDVDTAEEQQEAMLALLRQHQLTTIRTATGFANDTWRWRLYW